MAQPFSNGLEDVWLRFFTASGELVPLFAETERAAKEQEKRTDKEKGARTRKGTRTRRRNAQDKAERERTRLKEFLTAQGLTLPDEG